MRTAMRFPNDDSAIKKFRPLMALPEPNACLKKSEAEISFALSNSAFGTGLSLGKELNQFAIDTDLPAEKYATFARR